MRPAKGYFEEISSVSPAVASLRETEVLPITGERRIVARIAAAKVCIVPCMDGSELVSQQLRGRLVAGSIGGRDYEVELVKCCQEGDEISVWTDARARWFDCNYEPRAGRSGRKK